MRQRIAGRQRSQRQRCAHRLLQPSRIPQSPNQSVMCFAVAGIQGNSAAKGLRSLSRRPGSKQVQPPLAKLFGSVFVGCGHGYL